MDRRSFLRTSTAALGSAGVSDAAQVAREARRTRPESPNVIWLFGDQHRAQALSINGDPNVRTPNADILARTGVNFTSAVSGFPLCCPFRGSLLTGRYPHHCVPGHEYPILDDQPTIAKPLKDAGYRTAWFGKWHLGGFHERDGRGAMFIIPEAKRGSFETWVGYENNNSQWDSWVHGGTGRDAFHYRLPGYETDELTNLFVKYLKDRGDEAKAGTRQPFFAALSVQPPHDPYVAPEQYMRRFSPAKLELRPNVPAVPSVLDRARRDLAGYYAMIENWDYNVGRIRAALEEAGLAGNTHILYFSDHGDMHGSHGQFRKTSPWEESMRIPFLIGGIQARYEGWLDGSIPVPINHVDIAPTTLGLCGIRKPGWMEGTDYSHRRLQKPEAAAEPDSAYLQNVVPTGHGDSVNLPYRGVITKDNWKFVCFEGTPWLMFNLSDDPYELANLAHNNRYRVERKRLLDRLRQWVNETGDNFRVPEA